MIKFYQDSFEKKRGGVSHCFFTLIGFKGLFFGGGFNSIFKHSKSGRKKGISKTLLSYKYSVSQILLYNLAAVF